MHSRPRMHWVWVSAVKIMSHSSRVAWFEAFNISFAQLLGRDGGEWRLSTEFRFKDFLRALKGMQRGKSVGSGGFCVEWLLRAAGEDIQFAFFKAMMRDLENGQLSGVR
jgi:hypothetical protein